MTKTYVTTMPDHIGAFYKASKCFADLNINITRVSYNKAIDSHMLFIDVRGTEEQLLAADEELRKIGYLQSTEGSKNIVLLEFRLYDQPGSVTGVLALIRDFNINISYISSQENGTDYQLFKMGLFVEKEEKLQEFLKQARELCEVTMIDYNRADRNYDNSIFYTSFVTGIARMMGISAENQQELLVNTNLAMQTLDERGMSPYRTFDSISRFAELLSANRGESYRPRITRETLTEQTELLLIEPACGSNTTVLIHKENGTENYLFLDCGYACYMEEMGRLLPELLPDFNHQKKRIVITHADVDHCGLLPVFDEILTSKKSAESLSREYLLENGLREENPLHKPYIRICKILTSYNPPNPEKLQSLDRTAGEKLSFFDSLYSGSKEEELLRRIAAISFYDLQFDVYEGAGGHLPGEIVLIDFSHHLVFTGDIYLNLQGLTEEQKKYNQYAPILMTSVDTDPVLCGKERKALLSILETGTYRIYGAHGSCKELTL